MGTRANAAFFSMVARPAVDQAYPGHRTGEQTALE